MRTKAFLFGVVFLSLCNSAIVYGFATRTESADVKTQVLSPISIENTDGQGLEFGNIGIGALTSTIRVSSTLTVIPDVISGDAIVISTIDQTAAKFTVTGEVGNSYTINLPTSMIVTDGAHNLTINNFSCSESSGGTIDAVEVFFVGADLIVPFNAIPGTYQGTFSVVVSYN